MDAAPARRGTLLVQLVLDAVTGEVVAALRERGIRSILLKGPALARWLYPERTDRPYGDIDLLVAPEAFAQAERVLEQLGFETEWDGLRATEWAGDERHWTRHSGARGTVDLHRALFWTRLNSDATWRVLSGATEVMRIGGTEIEVLSVSARALVVALHAARDGPAGSKALADLRRAAVRVDEGTWLAAAELARRLEVEDALAAGLWLTPEGRATGERLGLAPSRSVEVQLLAGGAPATAIGFEGLREQPSARRRALFLLGKLFPSPTFMRRWQAVAGRGRAGLYIAYAWRPLWLVWKAPRGAVAWRRAQRPRRR